MKSPFIRISKRATQQNERNANFCKKDIVIIRAATWGHLYKLSSIITNKDGPSYFNNMSSYFHDCKRKVLTFMFLKYYYSLGHIIFTTDKTDKLNLSR